MVQGFLKTAAQDDFPKNQMFTYSNVMYILVNVVSSNNAFYDSVDGFCD
jgi:hypothetical protein